MLIEKTPFEGLLVLTPNVFADERGLFSETYREDLLTPALGYMPHFVQDNESCSALNVFRGLHFQVPPHAMAKLVRVSKGRVLDVVVDLRKSQRGYGKWFSIELSAENRKQLFIPEGFAHGFLALEEDSVFTYKCTDYYSKMDDRTLLWSDPAIGIKLPSELPFMSQKDKSGMAWADFHSPF